MTNIQIYSLILIFKSAVDAENICIQKVSFLCVYNIVGLSIRREKNHGKKIG